MRGSPGREPRCLAPEPMTVATSVLWLSPPNPGPFDDSWEGSPECTFHTHALPRATSLGQGPGHTQCCAPMPRPGDCSLIQ